MPSELSRRVSEQIEDILDADEAKGTGGISDLIEEIDALDQITSLPSSYLYGTVFVLFQDPESMEVTSIFYSARDRDKVIKLQLKGHLISNMNFPTVENIDEVVEYYQRALNCQDVSLSDKEEIMLGEKLGDGKACLHTYPGTSPEMFAKIDGTLEFLHNLYFV